MKMKSVKQTWRKRVKDPNHYCSHYPGGKGNMGGWDGTARPVESGGVEDWRSEAQGAGDIHSGEVSDTEHRSAKHTRRAVGGHHLVGGTRSSIMGTGDRTSFSDERRRTGPQVQGRGSRAGSCQSRRSHHHPRVGGGPMCHQWGHSKVIVDTGDEQVCSPQRRTTIRCSMTTGRVISRVGSRGRSRYLVTQDSVASKLR